MFQKAKMKTIRIMLLFSVLLAVLAMLFFLMGDLVPLALLFLALAVFLPIWGGTKLWKKNLVAYCSKTANPEDTFAQLSAFADEVPNTGMLKISPRWLLVTGKTMLQVMETSHVVWAYQNTTSQKLYGFITIAKSYGLSLALDNGKIYTISGSQNQVKETLNGLYQQTDHIMIGYDPRLAQMFQNQDYASLLDAAKQIRRNSAQA